jgi:indole-3-glycerol phosphate synthase
MILQRILAHKKAELRHKQSRGYLAEMKAKIRDAGPPLEFAVTIDATSRPTRPALIAEVKKASPSLGLLRPEFEEQFDPVKIATAYREHGATALSVLTDRDFFQGSLEYLAQVKQKVGLPCLNK